MRTLDSSKFLLMIIPELMGIVGNYIVVHNSYLLCCLLVLTCGGLRLCCWVLQGFTYPVRTHFLEDILEMTGYRLTPYNQIDDYGPDRSWKTNKQAFRKRKSQIASVVEVCPLLNGTICLFVMLLFALH